MRVFFSLLLSFLISLGLVSKATIKPQNFLFKENKGQWPNDVSFKGEIGSHSIWLQGKSITYQLVNEKLHPLNQLHSSRHGEKIDRSKPFAHVFKLNFENALSTCARPASKPVNTQFNYYLSNSETEWVASANAYESVVYSNLYKGIDLKIYGGNNFIKYDLELDEGIDAKQIKFSYEGLNGIEISGGKLRLKTSLGTIEEHIPKAYQLIEGQAKIVDCSFTLSNNIVGFKFSKPLNPKYKTIIDPILLFFTYSGSLSDNWANSAVSDAKGNSYTAGTVYGSFFPTTLGAFDRTFNGTNGNPYLNYDIGILKFNPTGSELLSCTYMGGNGSETPHSLVMDNNLNLVVMGSTSSSNFPTSSSGFQRTFGGGPAENPYGYLADLDYPSYISGSDLFIFKLSENGQRLIASSFLGGNGTDGIMNVRETLVTNYGDQFRGDVIIDSDNNIYIASHSHSANFPIKNASQGRLNGQVNGVICKLNANLSTLLWSTYFGGSEEDALYSVQLLGNDQLVVCGGTTSKDLSISANAYKKTKTGNDIDAVVAVYKRNNGQLLHATYSGTNSYDQSYIVQSDPQNNIYIFGQSQGQMPKSASTYGQANGGQFLQKFNSGLNQLIWGTTFGFSPFKPNISPTALMIDSCNRIFMAGWGGKVNYIGPGFAGGYTAGLPVSSDALQPRTDSSDFYFLVLSADAKNLVYGSYFGSSVGKGEHVDGGTSRFDRNGTITQAVCGCRGEDGNFFQGTPGAYRPEIGSGNCNNGVMKINLFDLKVDFKFTGELTCPANLTLRNNSQNGESYTWYFGNGDSLQSNNSSISYQYKTPGKYQIILKAINRKTCKYEAIRADSITIPNPFPFPKIEQEDLYCVGDTLFPVFEELRNYEIKWNPTIYLNDPTSYKPNITPLSSVNYVISAVDSKGCKSVSTYNMKNRKIELGFGVEKEFKPCEGTYTVRLFSNKDSSDQYVWYFENGDSAIGQAVTRIYKANGNYPIRLLGRKNSCIDNALDTLSLFEQKITLTPEFTSSRFFQSCDQPSVQFKNQSINSQAFIWDFGDGNTSTDIDPIHKFEKPGKYIVKLDGFRGICRTQIEHLVDAEEFKVPNLITINNDLRNETLEIKGLQPGWTLDIYNRWGKSVYHSNDYQNDWKAENLEEGTYFFNITFPEGDHCNGWVQAMKP